MEKVSRRPGRPRQDKVRVTVSLSRVLQEALVATQKNMSTFLEEMAIRDVRVAAYLAQQGRCKFQGCQELISLNETIYCSLSGNNGLCPGWFCREHYEDVHLSEEER